MSQPESEYSISPNVRRIVAKSLRSKWSVTRSECRLIVNEAFNKRSDKPRGNRREILKHAAYVAIDKLKISGLYVITSPPPLGTIYFLTMEERDENFYKLRDAALACGLNAREIGFATGFKKDCSQAKVLQACCDDLTQALIENAKKRISGKAWQKGDVTACKLVCRSEFGTTAAFFDSVEGAQTAMHEVVDLYKEIPDEFHPVFEIVADSSMDIQEVEVINAYIAKQSTKFITKKAEEEVTLLRGFN